jgi:hypothetical protein
MRVVVWWRGLPLLILLFAVAGVATAEPPEKVRPKWPRFRLFSVFRPFASAGSVPKIETVRTESLVRLPGDSDSVFTLGGPGPSRQARVRFAIEVNEAILKVLAPDPRIESTDMRGRSGGDWKPIDATGRPYQLRLGARLIW